MLTDLCLTVIAKNEARAIRRCLESARPFVVRMLVLDTGSDDETPEIAKSCGADVRHMQWGGSFAEARNVCLDFADAAWCLVLDADEWIDPQASPAPLSAHMKSSQSAGAVIIRSNIEIEGIHQVADSRVPRLIPGSTRYRGLIHEQPITNGPDIPLDFLVYHDGYSQSLVERKHLRNLELLKTALCEEPKSAYLHFQMAVQHETVGSWPIVLDHLLKARDLGAYHKAFAHAFTYRLIHAFARCGRFDEGLQIGLTARARWPDSRDIHFAFGNLCLDTAIADPHSAESIWLPAAEAAWLTCLKIGDELLYPDHIHGRGGHLAAKNLAVLYDGIGKACLARQFRESSFQFNKNDV
jgi:glycosyltransferase involved in cell wall biosynthesis